MKTISFLLALLLAITTFFTQSKATAFVELLDGNRNPFGYSETMIGGEPPVSLITMMVFIDVNAIKENHFVLPTISVSLSPTLETALQFQIYDRDTQKALEATLDEAASKIHDPFEVPMESTEGVDANSNSHEPWLTSIADDAVMVHSAGATTLIYTAIIPAHREGWCWTLVPERKTTVEIPLNIQEPTPTDIATNDSSENDLSRPMAETKNTPEEASQIDSGQTTATKQLPQQTNPKKSRTWGEWYHQLTPMQQDLIIVGALVLVYLAAGITVVVCSTLEVAENYILFKFFWMNIECRFWFL